MPDINPAHYQSVTDYLLALSFTIADNCFVKSGVSIPASEIIGCTPVTFHAKAKAKGWFTEEPREEPTLYQWGDQFVFTSDLLAPLPPQEVHCSMRINWGPTHVENVTEYQIDRFVNNVDAILSEDWTTWFKKRQLTTAEMDAPHIIWV